MLCCGDCGRAFEQPLLLHSSFLDGDNHRVSETGAVCPFCGGADLREGRRCPRCGGWRALEEPLCRRCTHHLHRQFASFVDSLSPEEQGLLDDWLDGIGVVQAAHRRY